MISFSSLARLSSCRLALIRACVACIVSIARSVVVSGVSYGISSEGGGGLIWLLVSRLVSRSVLFVPSLRLVRFPSYRLANRWRCVPFLSARSPHSLRSSSLVFARLRSSSLVFARLRSSAFVFARLRSSSVGGVAYRFCLSSRPSSRRLVSYGRLVAILCGSSAVPSCSSIRSAARLSSYSSFPVSSFVSLGRLVKQSVFSFRPAARGAFRVFSVPPPVSLFPVLVSSRSLRFMAMMAAARLFHLVAACSHPVAPSWDPIGR